MICALKVVTARRMAQLLPAQVVRRGGRHIDSTRYVSRLEFVEADGLRIAYERVGAGPLLVLVHGAAEDSRRIWQPQLAVLADEFTVVAWDEPGAGRSSDLPARMTLAGFADGLAALVGSLQPGPAHVAGLSWGGTPLRWSCTAAIPGSLRR